MEGSSLKRKQPDHAAGGAEATTAAGQQPPRLQSGDVLASPQQAKKQRAPHSEGGVQDGSAVQRQQRQAQQQQAQQQRQRDQAQQAVPLATSRQQQLELLPPLLQGHEYKQAPANGQGAGQQPHAALEQQQPQRVQQHHQFQQQQQRRQRQQHQQQQEQRVQQQQQPPPQQQLQMSGQGSVVPPLNQAAAPVHTLSFYQRQTVASAALAGVQQQQQAPLRQLAEALALPQPLGLPLHSVVPWQQPPLWPTAAMPGWPQTLQQPWDQQQQAQQALPVWDPSMGPAWDPMQQQWATAPAAAQAPQQAPPQPPPQRPSSAAPASHPGLGWQAQAAALQQGVQQPGKLQDRSRDQSQGQGQHTTKLQRDVPPGGPGEAFLRLAVRVCCQRLGLGEHDGKQLGKVLEEMDRNWRTSMCGGHSVSVLLKELDRRGLVAAREDTSGGKRICYFRNLAC